MSTAEATRDDSPQLFGHPRGLTYLFTTEMWERFSYYGMRALLVLYMTKFLLLPGHSEGVIGLASLKHMLESIFGPLGVQPFSSHIYGYYTGLVYFTPLIGGLISGRRRCRRAVVAVSLRRRYHLVADIRSPSRVHVPQGPRGETSAGPPQRLRLVRSTVIVSPCRQRSNGPA